MNRQKKSLRALINSGKILSAPGAFDVWSAKLVEKAGFPAVYMTGYGVSASILGQPDIGLISYNEMVTVARNIAAAVDIPLIADADNGYGNVLNVMQTVQGYEKAGVAGIQLEDQVMPKRCGHMEGKQLISMEEMVGKIKAAVYARENEETMIIARTDAVAVNGFEDAVLRANAYHEAGADILFVEALQSEAQIKMLKTMVKAPLMANMVEGGKTPLYSADELEKLGFHLVIYPVNTLYTATKAIKDSLVRLQSTGDLKACLDMAESFSQYNELIGLDDMRALEKRFTVL